MKTVSWKAFRLCVRLLLHIVLVGASCAVLWGLVKTSKDLKSCWIGGSCLLFGSVESNATACGVSNLRLAKAGNEGACHYSLFFAVAQLLAGILLFAVAIVRWRTGNMERSRCLNTLELTIVALAVLSSLVAAIILSAGLGVFCNQLTSNFRPEPSLLVSPKTSNWRKPSCSAAYIAQNVKVHYHATGHSYTNTFDKVFFYDQLNVSQIGAWVSVLAWLLHIALSSFAWKVQNKESMGLYSQLTTAGSVDNLTL